MGCMGGPGWGGGSGIVGALRTEAEAETGGLFGLVGGGGAGVGLVLAGAAVAAAADEASVLFVSVLLPLVQSDVVAVMAHAYSKLVLLLVLVFEAIEMVFIF